jgi:hypothetical protein
MVFILKYGRSEKAKDKFDPNLDWEGTTEDGEGDGEFKIAEHGDDPDSWVAYVAALK